MKPRCAVTEDSDPLAGFSPDEALEEIRALCHEDDLEARGDPLAILVAALDDHIVRSGGTALPVDWQYEPAVHFERLMRNQPRRTSRKDRR
jgi:hypothetical protein